jgi:hypothetical protein
VLYYDGFDESQDGNHCYDGYNIIGYFELSLFREHPAMLCGAG